MWWFLQMVANFLRCCLIIDVLQQRYSQLYSLLSYSQRYLGACIVFCVFWVCVWVGLCVWSGPYLISIWFRGSLEMHAWCERLGSSLLSPCPVTLWRRLLLRSTSQFSAAAFRGEGSFLFVSYWFLYNWSFLVIDKASLTPPGSQIPGSLETTIKNYWLPLSPPHFPRFGQLYAGGACTLVWLEGLRTFLVQGNFNKIQNPKSPGPMHERTTRKML